MFAPPCDLFQLTDYASVQRGDTPLISAACGGNVDSIRALVELGADLEGQANVRLGCQRRCATCTPEPAVPDSARAQNGFTPLLCAAYYGQADAVSALIELGADLEARDEVRFSQPLA